MSAERFAREVKLAARLQHPNIVPVLSAGATGGMPYYTMPFVDGHSLRARIQQGRVPVPEAVSILRDVARALAYAHAQGVVHRDIKPENILLSGGAAVVTDFGIAKALSASRTQGRRDLRHDAGTHADRDVARHAGVHGARAGGGRPDTDHRADLYAWGVVAYELLAGAHPFADAHAARADRRARARRPAVARRATGRRRRRRSRALVMRCLEKDPGATSGVGERAAESLDAVSTPVARVRRADTQRAPMAARRARWCSSSSRPAHCVRGDALGRGTTATAANADVDREVARRAPVRPRSAATRRTPTSPRESPTSSRRRSRAFPDCGSPDAPPRRASSSEAPARRRSARRSPSARCSTARCAAPAIASACRPS